MKRKAVVVGLGCVLIMGVSLLAIVVRDARRMARWDSTQAGMNNLAAAIELYQNEHQRYPASLEELQSEAGAKVKDLLNQNRIFENSFKDTFGYKPSSNSFVITATSQSWFIEPKIIERKYMHGEVLK